LRLIEPRLINPKQTRDLLLGVRWRLTPILFPPVRVQTPAEACGWYVDGAPRLNAPIKPALDLGADRLVVIGAKTPAAYVEALRIERARDLLEDGAPSLEAVAQATGFASAEVMRRTFHRRVGVSPAEYRERFRLNA
jgi:predicted acylesterase/phospholipase RssA